jgi:hypothetical protein
MHEGMMMPGEDSEDAMEGGGEHSKCKQLDQAIALLQRPRLTPDAQQRVLDLLMQHRMDVMGDKPAMDGEADSEDDSQAYPYRPDNVIPPKRRY